MNAILHNLSARQAFTSSPLEYNFSQTSGWIELAGVSALMAVTFFLSEYLISEYFSGHRRNFLLLRHTGCRLLWPLLMMITGALALLVCNLMEFHAVWLHLPILAARWMILIRASVAMVHAASPQNRLTDWLERVISMVLWVGFVLWLSGSDDKILGTLEATRFAVGSGKLSLLTILDGIPWVGTLMIGASWLARFIGERLEKSSLDTDLSMILPKVVKTVMMVLAILIALPLIGIDLTVLSVFDGTLGVGIGFGLQKVTGNYTLGFIILGDHSIRMSDRLMVSNFADYVTKITSRFVVLRSANGTEVLVPNETFAISMVVNESYTSRKLQWTFNIQIAYHSDLIKALNIIKSATATQPQVSANPAPLAVVTNFGDNDIGLYVTYWVKDPENGFTTLQSTIFLDIWRQFNERGIELPHPQREVCILNESLAPSNIAMTKTGMQARSDIKSSPATDAAGND